MTLAEKAQLDEHVQAIAKILYADADKSQNDGYLRRVKSMLGHLPLSSNPYPKAPNQTNLPPLTVLLTSVLASCAFSGDHTSYVAP